MASVAAAAEELTQPIMAIRVEPPHIQQRRKRKAKRNSARCCSAPVLSTWSSYYPFQSVGVLATLRAGGTIEVVVSASSFLCRKDLDSRSHCFFVLARRDRIATIRCQPSEMRPSFYSASPGQGLNSFPLSGFDFNQRIRAPSLAHRH